MQGASSGIGLAASKFFSEHGSKVVAVDVNAFPEKLTNTTFHKLDLTKWDEQYDLFQSTKDTHGSIDIVFLNAGVAEIEDVFVDTFDEAGRLKEPQYKVLAVNQIAVINGTKLAIHFMKRQIGLGSIVITGSGKCMSTLSLSEHRNCRLISSTGFNGIGGTPMYAVAKHGVSAPKFKTVRRIFY